MCDLLANRFASYVTSTRSCSGTSTLRRVNVRLVSKSLCVLWYEYKKLFRHKHTEKSKCVTCPQIALRPVLRVQEVVQAQEHWDGQVWDLSANRFASCVTNTRSCSGTSAMRRVNVWHVSKSLCVLCFEYRKLFRHKHTETGKCETCQQIALRPVLRVQEVVQAQAHWDE
jgi:hypothetical protein